MKKLGKKKIIAIFAAILLLALVLGLFVIPIYRLPAPATLWDVGQLAKTTVGGSFARTQWIDLDETYFRQKCYFGKYNGYYVVSLEKHITNIYVETIGDYSFVINSYTIALCKGNTQMSLAEAYGTGIISDKNLAKIHEYHLMTLRDFELDML